MLKINGILLNIIPKMEYKKQGETLATPVKAKQQIIVKRISKQYSFYSVQKEKKFLKFLKKFFSFDNIKRGFLVTPLSQRQKGIK